MTDGIARQQVEAAGQWTLGMRDLTGMPEAGKRTGEFVDAFINESIDHHRGPLFKVELLKLDEQDHILAIAIDHMISDGMSLVIMLRDVCEIYVQCARGQTLPIPKASLQYAGYAVWQQKSCLHWQETHSRYWAARLSGARPLCFPIDRDIAELRPVRWEGMQIQFGVTLTAQLRERVIRERTTLPMCLLALFTILVARWCNTRDVVVPFNAVGRNVPELADTIGYFAHILHLRVQLNWEDTFRDILSRIVKEYCTASAHDDFGRIVASMPEFTRSLWFQCEPPSIEDAEVAHFQEDIKLEAFPDHQKKGCVSR